VSGFVFDARAARMAIASRRAGAAKVAVCAVLAADRGARIQDPQEPQQPQGRRIWEAGPKLARQPQEPQQPQEAAIPLGEMADAIEERAALAADSVPAVYLEAWARLQCLRPLTVAEDVWRLAINDGGALLDAWGAKAVELRWPAHCLFAWPRPGKPGGLIWHLQGERVEALGEQQAWIGDGRIFNRLDPNREIAGLLHER
jgi:hypothetical protein